MTPEQLRAFADWQAKAPAGVSAAFDGEIALVTVSRDGVVESARIVIPFGLPPGQVAGHIKSARALAERKIRLLTEDDDDKDNE